MFFFPVDAMLICLFFRVIIPLNTNTDRCRESSPDNRETGANPARTRHCNRMVHRYNVTGKTREGSGRTMIRKSGNLPVF